MVIVFSVHRLALSSSTRDDHGKLLGNYRNSLALQDQSRAFPHANSFDDKRSFMGQVANVQGPKRTRSPPVTSANSVSWENPLFASSDSKRLTKYMLADFSYIPTVFSTVLSLVIVFSVNRPALSSSTWDDHAKFLGNYPNSLAQQDQSRALPHANSYDDERSFMGQVANVKGPKRTSSPPITSANGVSWENPDSKRLVTYIIADFSDSYSFSHHYLSLHVCELVVCFSCLTFCFFSRQGNRSNAVFSTPNSQVSQRSASSLNNAVGATRSNVYSVPKRTRSPPLPSVGQDLQENSNFTQNDAER